VDAGSIASPCTENDSTLICAVKLRKQSYPFGVAVKAVPGYTLDKIWMRIRRHDGSGDKDLVIHHDDVTAGNFALFQFHPKDVASKLGISMEKLELEGFQIRPKIKSLGAGSNRQDKCVVVSMRYSEADSVWTWAKNVSPNSEYKLIGTKFTILYKSARSIN